jgi:hypothetical protein
MTRTSLIALVVGGLLGFSVHAQDPQKPAARDPAAAAPVPGQEPDPTIIVGLMECLAEGLPEGWKKTWFVIQQINRDAESGVRQYEAKFYYATDPADRVGKRLDPCGANRIVDGVIALNAYLQPGQRRWAGVTMTFNIDGTYDAAYDYTVRKPDPVAAPAKAAAKPAAKKKQEAAK